MLFILCDEIMDSLSSIDASECRTRRSSQTDLSLSAVQYISKESEELSMVHCSTLCNKYPSRW